MASLLLAALTIFLTSDWRLSLTALLVEYLMTGLALTPYIQAEVVLVKILAGMLVVSILYISVRRTQSELVDKPPAWGIRVAWSGGPLGLPLRLLVSLLVLIAVLRFYDNLQTSFLSSNIILLTLWMVAMGMTGLVITSDPQRIAPALLTILLGFDLAYSKLESSLAIVGFLATLHMLTAFAFSYLIIAQALPSSDPEQSYSEVEQ